MKIIACGDWHISNNAPARRLDDDYFDTCLTKVEYIMEYADIHKINTIIQAGDFFDSHRASDNVKQSLLRLLLGYEDIDIYTIMGQHDQRFHSSDVNNTPSKVLDSARAVTLVGNKGHYLLNPDADLVKTKPIHLYGSSWNETPPVIQNTEAINILVMHRMITQDKLWESQEDFIFSKNLFRQYKFDYFITGDNHQHFTTAVAPRGRDKRYLINCGSLMRTSIIQAKHAPCFYVIDTDANTIEQQIIPVAPFDKVMNLAAAIEDKRVSDELQQFIDALSVVDLSNRETYDFIGQLKELAEQVPEAVQVEINAILTQAEGEK